MKNNQHAFRLRGSSMLVILMVIFTLSVCIAASLDFTTVVSRDVERSNTWRRAHDLGDGALDYAFTSWRAACRAQTNTQLPTSSFSSIPTPTASMFPSISNFTVSTGASPTTGTPYTVSNFKVQAADQFWVPLTDSTAAPPAQTGMSLGTTNFNYIASADVSLPTMTGAPIKVKARRIFTKSLQSPWNYAIFYVDDLEIHPGAPMSVTGWVNTNGTLYTAHNTLSFLSKVSYSNDWSVNFKPGDSRLGTETPTTPTWVSNLPPFRDQSQQPFGLDSTQIFNTTDASANNDSYRELIETPQTGSDPLSSSRYYNQADVKILVNSAGTPTYYNSSGAVISASSAAGSNNLKLYQAFSAATTIGTTITDKREGVTVRLIDVDVSVLNAKLTAVGAPAFNGIAYISDQSANATTKRAVRLKNGATIGMANGLTVATDNGMYIQGDYNTGRTGSSEPPSNTGTATQPYVTGYTRKPCAVLADAVTILSNSWNDSNSSSGISSRVASPTTVNTAIVSGIVATTGTAASPSTYSGGAENFPRFLEDWSSKTFTYSGSMVELFPSQQFNTQWGGSNVYNPPTRRWYFDTNFYKTPPPGTLTLVAYNKSRWYTE